METKGTLGLRGSLAARVIRNPGPHRARSLRTPFGRLLLTRDPGDASILASEYFQTHLFAVRRDGDGIVTGEYDLGSGTVTNMGVMAMANDYAWSAQLNLATLATQNFQATGTGGTASASTDVIMQTLAAPTTVTAVTGTQSLVSGANLQIYRNVATVNYASTLGITEWGLHSLAALSSTTGTPFTATSGTTWTDTGSAQTASSATVRGLQQTAVFAGTTAVYGLNLSNTTHVGTIPAWYKTTDGTAGATPGATEAFSIKPILFDHKTFSSIGVNSGDNVQYTWSLTIQSGG